MSDFDDWGDDNDYCSDNRSDNVIAKTSDQPMEGCALNGVTPRPVATQQPDEYKALVAEAYDLAAKIPVDGDLKHKRYIRLLDILSKDLLAMSPKREYVDQWHPIETAPKDEDILLFGHYLYGGDKGSTEYIYLGSWGDGAWLCDSERFTTNSFSHWMSLPKPPIYQIEGGKPDAD